MIGPWTTALETAGNSYRLVVPHSAIDANRFHDLVTAARDLDGQDQHGLLGTEPLGEQLGGPRGLAPGVVVAGALERGEDLAAEQGGPDHAEHEADQHETAAAHDQPAPRCEEAPWLLGVTGHDRILHHLNTVHMPRVTEELNIVKMRA